LQLEGRRAHRIVPYIGILGLGLVIVAAFLLIQIAQPPHGSLSATALQAGTTRPSIPGPAKPKDFTGSPIDGQGI
jgi:hypothetical protein